MVELLDLQEPKCKNVTNYQLLSGKNIPEIKILELLSCEDFEILTEQWAYSKKDLYCFVKRTGGANDSGRDIFCFKDEQKTQLDIYQCKHYENKIQPVKISVEIGKLLYYTYIEDFIIPQKYYIVSSKGCGSALTKLIETPIKFKNYIISNWDKYCKESITNEKHIALDGDFKQYVLNFDFSIINEITPLQLLDEFEKTKYYSGWFGLKKFHRPIPPKPTANIQKNELNYINKLLDAYGSVNNEQIKDCSQLKEEYSNHLAIQRKCFYSAEGLKQFSRDSSPTEETFEDLQEQIIDPVKSHITCKSFKNGVECFDSAANLAHTLQIGNNFLTEFLRTNDRIGILHQVANEDIALKWVKNDSIK